MALSNHVPSPFNKSNNHANGNIDSPGGESSTDLMATEIPVDNAMVLTAAAAGIISDEDVTSSRWDMDSPWSAISDLLDRSKMRDVNNDCDKDMNVFQDYASETSENQTNDIEKTCKVHDDVQSPASGPNGYRSHQSSECIHSFEPLFRGGKINIHPLEHLQVIEYQYRPVSTLGLCDKYLDKLKDSNEESQVKLRLAAAEEAVPLSLSSTATICRVLSLENVLALVTDVSLKKHVIVVCQNLGVLSAVVLSIIPIIRLFEWHLFLPILPGKMLDFLDAPVPFIVGIQQKPADQKMKTSTLVEVNVVKDQVSIHVKDSFIDSFPSRDQSFIKLFVETQLFTVLSDSRFSSYENGDY